MAALGVREPFRAPLYERRVYTSGRWGLPFHSATVRPACCASDAVITDSRLIACSERVAVDKTATNLQMLEAEFGFVMGARRACGLRLAFHAIAPSNRCARAALAGRAAAPRRRRRWTVQRGRGVGGGQVNLGFGRIVVSE